MATEHDTESIKRQTSFVSESKTNGKDTGLGQDSNTNRSGFHVNTKSVLAGNNTRNSWESCYYCPCEHFKAVTEFVK